MDGTADVNSEDKKAISQYNYDQDIETKIKRQLSNRVPFLKQREFKFYRQ